MNRFLPLLILLALALCAAAPPDSASTTPDVATPAPAFTLGPGAAVVDSGRSGPAAADSRPTVLIQTIDGRFIEVYLDDAKQAIAHPGIELKDKFTTFTIPDAGKVIRGEKKESVGVLGECKARNNGCTCGQECFKGGCASDCPVKAKSAESRPIMLAQCAGGSCAAPSYTGVSPFPPRRFDPPSWFRSGNPFDNGTRIEVVVPGYTVPAPVATDGAVRPLPAPAVYYLPDRVIPGPWGTPQYTAPRPRTAYFPGGEYRTFGAPARRGFFRGGLRGVFGGCLGGCR